ncbi:MAG: HNH endonuclease [Waterburya sp.]
MGRSPDLPDNKAFLLRKQKGKCNWCGLHFREGDTLEKDHIIPTALCGKNVYENFQLLHGHCHDAKTTLDLIDIRNKRASDFFKRLTKEWSKLNYLWIDDIPVLIGC